MTRPPHPVRARLALLAAGVVSLAACGGDPGAPTALTVTGTDELAFEPERLEAPAGELAVTLRCGNAVPHNIVIEQAGDTLVAECGPGGADSGTIQLDAGAYTYYCDVPGHREAGMEGTLTVS